MNAPALNGHIRHLRISGARKAIVAAAAAELRAGTGLCGVDYIVAKFRKGLAGMVRQREGIIV
jgi:hypothetical protein